VVASAGRLDHHRVAIDLTAPTTEPPVAAAEHMRRDTLIFAISLVWVVAIVVVIVLLLTL
jgi:hypothetical protein